MLDNSIVLSFKFANVLVCCETLIQIYSNLAASVILMRCESRLYRRFSSHEKRDKTGNLLLSGTVWGKNDFRISSGLQPSWIIVVVVCDGCPIIFCYTELLHNINRLTATHHDVMIPVQVGGVCKNEMWIWKKIKTNLTLNIISFNLKFVL